MKYVSNERGALPLLVAILVVALFGVVGMAVYNANKAHNKEASSTGVSSASPVGSPVAAASPTPTPAPMLTIKELGVEIPLTGAPAGLTYQYSISGGVESAKLGTTATVSSCGYGRLGEIVKQKGPVPNAGPVPGVGTHFNTTDQSGKTVYYFLKQYSGYFIQHIPSQNPCQLPDGSLFPDKATSLATLNVVNGLQPTQ
jgi:hypothetical protein